MKTISFFLSSTSLTPLTRTSNVCTSIVCVRTDRRSRFSTVPSSPPPPSAVPPLLSIDQPSDRLSRPLRPLRCCFFFARPKHAVEAGFVRRVCAQEASVRRLRSHACFSVCLYMCSFLTYGENMLCLPHKLSHCVCVVCAHSVLNSVLFSARSFGILCGQQANDRIGRRRSGDENVDDGCARPPNDDRTGIFYEFNVLRARPQLYKGRLSTERRNEQTSLGRIV